MSTQSNSTLVTVIHPCHQWLQNETDTNNPYTNEHYEAKLEKWECHACHQLMHATYTCMLHPLLSCTCILNPFLQYWNVRMYMYSSVWWFIWSPLFKAMYVISFEAFVIRSSLLCSCEKLKADQSFDCLPSTETKSSSYFNWHMQYVPMYAHVNILLHIHVLLLGYYRAYIH